MLYIYRKHCQISVCSQVVFITETASNSKPLYVRNVVTLSLEEK